MSVKVMGWVWDADLPKEEKFILLAYADHADHEGGNVYPAVSMIVHKTGYSERSVRKFKGKLIERGILVEYGTSQYGTPVYWIDKEKIPELAPRKMGDSSPGRPEKTPAPHAPPEEKPLHAAHKTPAPHAPPEEKPLHAAQKPLHAAHKTPAPHAPKPSVKPSCKPLEDELFVALVKLVDIPAQLITTKTQRQFENFVIDLVELGEPPGALACFGEWWYANDWRGLKGQPPRIDHIRENWNLAKQNGDGQKVTVIE